MEPQQLGTIRVKERVVSTFEERVHLEQSGGELIVAKSNKCVARRQRFIKVSHHGPARKRWVPLSRHIWEQANGRTVPAGCQIYFRDRDPMNDSIDNLVLVRRGHLYDIAQIYPEVVAENRKKRIPAVKRSNRLRVTEMASVQQAFHQPQSWYAVLTKNDLILWRPFATEAEAASTCTDDYLAAIWARDAIFARDKVEFGGGVAFVRGDDLTKLMRPDAPLEHFRRYIPDDRPVPKKRRKQVLLTTAD